MDKLKSESKSKVLVPHSIFLIGQEKDVEKLLEEPHFSYSLDKAANEDGHITETKNAFKERLLKTLSQMMFVSGEQAEPSAETTYLIEEIVREQVIEMVSPKCCLSALLVLIQRQLKEATILANRRGSKSISIVDLIFQIRHNTAKVSRLKTFLSWKDVRKNVKDSDDKGGGDADAIDLEDVSDCL